MTQKERLKEAIQIFSKNEYWKEYYETAPSKLCKDYIACEFSRSEFHVPADLTREKAIEPNLTKVDWEHLLRYAGGNQQAAAIKAKMQAYGF